MLKHRFNGNQELSLHMKAFDNICEEYKEEADGDTIAYRTKLVIPKSGLPREYHNEYLRAHMSLQLDKETDKEPAAGQANQPA